MQIEAILRVFGSTPPPSRHYMNLVKRLFQHGVDRFKRGKGCEAQRSKAVWQHQSDAKQGALRDLTFRTEANMQAIYMLMDSPSWRPNWWLLSACARRSQRPMPSDTSISPQSPRRCSSVRDGPSAKLGSYCAPTLVSQCLIGQLEQGGVKR